MLMGKTSWSENCQLCNIFLKASIKIFSEYRKLKQIYIESVPLVNLLLHIWKAGKLMVNYQYFTDKENKGEKRHGCKSHHDLFLL